MALSVTSDTFVVVDNEDGSFDLTATIKRDPVTYVMVYLFYTKGTESKIAFNSARRDSDVGDLWCFDPKKDASSNLSREEFYMAASDNIAIPFNKAKNEDGFKLKVTPTGTPTGTLIAEIVTYADQIIVRP